MTQKQREAILKVMLGNIPEHSVEGVVLTEMLTQDIDAIEPIIDEIERQAEQRGRSEMLSQIQIMERRKR